MRNVIPAGRYIHVDGDDAAHHASWSVKLAAKDRVAEPQMAEFNAAHWWFDYPAMDSDGGVSINTFDSARDVRNRLTLFTAFVNLNSAADAALRQSLAPAVLFYIRLMMIRCICPLFGRLQGV